MASELRRGFGGNGGGDSLIGLDACCSSSSDTNSGMEFVLQSLRWRYLPCGKMLVILNNCSCVSFGHFVELCIEILDYLVLDHNSNFGQSFSPLPSTTVFVNNCTSCLMMQRMRFVVVDGFDEYCFVYFSIWTNEKIKMKRKESRKYFVLGLVCSFQILRSTSVLFPSLLMPI